MPSETTADQLVKAAKKLSTELGQLEFSPPVSHVYNPLDYAWRAHEAYLRKYGDSRKRILMLGMNPGPFGMAQTSVPFGEIAAVRDWMGIEEPVGKPEPEHPKRPVDGFACPKSEVSGRRLWGLFSEVFPDARDFFAEHFIANYCPLAFMSETGANITPDKLPAAEMKPVAIACDEHLQAVVSILQPEWLLGIGGWAHKRLQALFDSDAFRIGTILHPSPASPAANRGWAEAATKQLNDLGVWKGPETR